MEKKDRFDLGPKLGNKSSKFEFTRNRNKRREDSKNRPFNKLNGGERYDSKFEKSRSSKPAFEKPIYNKDERRPRFNEEENKPAEPKEKYLELGTILKVKVTSYTHEGLAVAKIDIKDKAGNEYTNYPLFIFGMLLDEEGLVEIYKIQKTYAYARVTKLFKDLQSSERVTPICPRYTECGGCNIMHMNYNMQKAFKRLNVVNTLTKIGGFEDPNVDECLGLEENSLCYRNKVQVPVASVKGKMVCGFYRRETHDIIPIDKCYIQPDESTEIIKFTRNLCNEFGLKGYIEKKHEGDLRHILVRKTYDGLSYMVVLVCTHNDVFNDEDKELFVKKLTARHPVVKSIIVNVNDKKGNTIMGSECTTLYGKSYLTDMLLGKKFKIGATSFYQVNHDGCEMLYQKAFDLANVSKDDIVIDAYSGIGTIGLLVSDKVKHVYGVDIVPEAIKNAKENIKLNKIDNATYVCAKAEEQIVKWLKLEEKPTMVFVDPPRKGCDKVFLETLVKMNVNKIVYISCDVSTLARDLRYLVDNGYEFERVTPVDMFPQTNHIENVVCLTKKC